ncbi:MAG: hypothetical protein KXJ50_06790 [Vulcanococcus sp.]|jgi:hypothetical protein|uniref:hypothetical protein n=1 Tax=Vulcanococcus sp. TaxID=2856995 RepID=UPI0025D737A0|nr:hypothetical protein [Vulcanococcus sp.]MBW0174840.1 hypothetical protein [Vulcanococcus sp.]MBW0180758.1 hypothetical protein [Vulcanococcus sp.]
MLVDLERVLNGLGGWLIRADLGLGLLLVVGISMSLSHVFGLLANRLGVRQILWRLLIDALVLASAFLLSSSIDMVLLNLYGSNPVHPSAFVDGIASCLLPACFYVCVAAPYIGETIGLVLWVLVHLNVITFVHVRFDLPWDQALVLTTPGYLLALVLVALLFRQSWQRGYAMLASELAEP